MVAVIITYSEKLEEATKEILGDPFVETVFTESRWNTMRAELGDDLMLGTFWTTSFESFKKNWKGENFKNFYKLIALDALGLYFPNNKSAPNEIRKDEKIDIKNENEIGLQNKVQFLFSKPQWAYFMLSLGFVTGLFPLDLHEHEAALKQWNAAITTQTERDTKFGSNAELLKRQAALRKYFIANVMVPNVIYRLNVSDTTNLYPGDGQVINRIALEGVVGDFFKETANPRNRCALFIFSDNDQRRGRGGTAKVRDWQTRTPPRALGIPVGNFSTALAFANLDALTINYLHGSTGKKDVKARVAIEDALKVISSRLSTGRYNKVIYSASGLDVPASLQWRSTVFVMPRDVKDFIMEGLYRVTQDTANVYSGPVRFTGDLDQVKRAVSQYGRRSKEKGVPPLYIEDVQTELVSAILAGKAEAAEVEIKTAKLEKDEYDLVSIQRNLRMGDNKKSEGYDVEYLQGCIKNISEILRGADWERALDDITRLSFTALWILFIMARHAHPSFPMLADWGVIIRFKRPLLATGCLFQSGHKPGEPEWAAKCFNQGELVLGSGGDQCRLFIRNKSETWSRLDLEPSDGIVKKMRERLKIHTEGYQTSHQIDEDIWKLVRPIK